MTDREEVRKIVREELNGGGCAFAFFFIVIGIFVGLLVMQHGVEMHLPWGTYLIGGKQ